MAEESSPDTDINLNTNGSCSAILSVLYMYVDRNVLIKDRVENQPFQNHGIVYYPYIRHPHKIT